MGVVFSGLSSLLLWSGRLISLILVIHHQPVHAQTDSEIPTWSVKQLVESQQQLHPQLRVQDVYKLFYEATFGVGHFLADSSGAASDLMNELGSLDSGSAGEPLLESISLNGGIVRVNLRPFKALNLDASKLVKVMFQSARETLPDTLMFNRLWNEFSGLVKYGLLRFPADEVKVWEKKVEGGTIEPVHHSSEYSVAHRPAYRVARRGTFESTFGKISQ